MAETNVADIKIQNIKGNINTGDVFTTVNNYQSFKRKIHFETLTAGMDAFTDFPKPDFTDQLLSKAKSEQLVLLSGNGGFNKGLLLRYIAVLLKTDGFEVKECSDFTDFHSLSAAIQEESGRIIFVLYNLTAEAINFRWNDFKALARKKDHIILSSTEATYDAWRFEEDKPDPSWCQVPDEALYSKETLCGYLEAALTRKSITLPVSLDAVVEKLTAIEQLDIFVDMVTRSSHKENPEEIQKLIEVSRLNNQTDFNAWYYGLDEFQKITFLGISLFEGAYEGQVFAGFDRIFRASWRHRNSQLRSIDYEDLIPLKAYIKTEGQIIQGKLEHQRKKVVQLAWRTHRRYILSALPVLLDIVNEAADPDEYDLDLYRSYNHRTRIRRVVSDTLSDIALQSFEDGNQPLLLLASKANIRVQSVTAAAISRWRSFGQENESRMYEVLDLWQEYTADALQESAQAAESKKEIQQGLSNVRGAIALALYFASEYDAPNALSPSITDLLLKFLDNNESAIIDPMQIAVENITNRHPVSMQYYLRDKFLQYDYYVGPTADGLTNAYNNGQVHAIKNILEDWLIHYKSLPGTLANKDAFGHKERLLTAIILTLKYIDYDAPQQAYTIGEAHKMLEALRKDNHNTFIRQFLLDAIIHLAQKMHAGKEHQTIETIANLDANERDVIVRIFREKYLKQRTELEGGDYRVLLEGEWMDGWRAPGKRPRTKVEELVYAWQHKDALRQVAFQTINKLKDIEAEEKKMYDEYEKQQEKESKLKAEEEKQLAENGNARYDGEIKSSVESKAFIKICKPYVPGDMLNKVEDMYKVAIHDKIPEAHALELISALGDKQPALINQVTFIYKLFVNGKFEPSDNPANRNFQSNIMVLLGSPGVGNKRLLRAFAPLILAAPDLDAEERRAIFTKIAPYNPGQLQRAYFIARHPLVLIPIMMFLIYIIFKIVFLIK